MPVLVVRVPVIEPKVGLAVAGDASATVAVRATMLAMPTERSSFLYTAILEGKEGPGTWSGSIA
ncbi:hypothetical protein GCM10009779_03230 [Polymorphospora rubra]|uniref:Uncharacterized protein n=1 Tax=Polymorphospora rubra TaxID=338584 RepID=A0A810MYU0_9ACTN|nr:hypothetical protein Prubr_26550 [Polymorphospora rubra]